MKTIQKKEKGKNVKTIKPNQYVRTKGYSLTQKNLLNYLCKTYPNVFNSDEPVPLKIGIKNDIIEELKEYDPTLSKKLVSSTLMLYTSRLKYKMSLLKNSHRMGLDGSSGDEIKSEHKHDASYSIIYFIRGVKKHLEKKNK